MKRRDFIAAGTFATARFSSLLGPPFNSKPSKKAEAIKNNFIKTQIISNENILCSCSSPDNRCLLGTRPATAVYSRE